MDSVRNPWQAPDANGMMCVTAPTATYALMVRDGIVVECAPYARRFALGRRCAEEGRR